MTSPSLVGARCDYLTQTFRVALDEHVLRMLRACAARAKRDQSPVAAVVGGQAFMLAPGQIATRWCLRNDHRTVMVDEKAPGGEGDAPGWNVSVETTGAPMLELGYRGAILGAWKTALALGDVVQTRFGRIDLNADEMGYGLSEHDRKGFIKQRRVSSADFFQDGREVVRPGRERRKTDGSIERKEHRSWQVDFTKTGTADEGGQLVAYRGGDTFTGYRVGGGKTIMLRIYDKLLELRGQSKDKAAAEHASMRAHGWDGVADVARVEFQLRGEALDELKLRHLVWGDVGPEAHADMFAASLDPTWAYCTREWFRIERPGKGELQERWRVVQSATFVRAAAPTVRVRQRGLAKAAQAFGAGCSFLARVGELPAPSWPARVSADGVIDEQRLAEDADVLVAEEVGNVETPEQGHARAAQLLTVANEILFARVAAEVTRAQLAKWPTATEAYRANVSRRQAMLARCAAPPLEWYGRGRQSA